jgi:hypothetical protein
MQRGENQLIEGPNVENVGWFFKNPRVIKKRWKTCRCNVHKNQRKMAV